MGPLAMAVCSCAMLLQRPSSIPLRCCTASDSDLACVDAVIKPWVEWNEHPAFRVVEIHGVRDGDGIPSLAGEIGFGVLEGRRHIDRAPHAEEQRSCVP